MTIPTWLMILTAFLNGITLGISVVNLLWLNEINRNMDAMRKGLQ